MASRNIDDLKYPVRVKCRQFVELCKQEGIEVLIYCTARSPEEQSILYRQSRTLNKIKEKAKELSDVYGRSDLAKILLGVGPQNGPHVTNAGPGQSLHNYGLAFDGCPIIHGKPVWDIESNLWEIYGGVADQVGLTWAGNWKSFKEFPHCQETGVRWQDLIGVNHDDGSS